jgi:hypothetical protein
MAKRLTGAKKGTRKSEEKSKDSSINLLYENKTPGRHS